MKKEEKLILMYKDFEVLSFNVDYVNEKITFLEKLAHFDKAPHGIVNEKDANWMLLRFFNARTISFHRRDYQKIMDATHSKDGFELSFKGHGLSLSNHFWFKREGEQLKYDEINFFNNKWDDTFAKAVLNEDYEALKTCDLNVPDIVTPGWGVKGWIYDNGPKLYKIGIDKDHPEEAICEVLASRLANRMFNSGETLLYELKTINGRYASVSSSILGVDEELIPIANIMDLDMYSIYKNRIANKDKGKEFFERIAEIKELPGLSEFFVKLSCFRCLGFVSDLHFNNISVIRNMKTNTIRIAPLFDFGGAFGSSESGRTIMSNADKAMFLIIYFIYNDFDPDWDYSWYDPTRLVGFEEEIKEYLSKTDFYTPEIIDRVIEVYHQQKKTLDEMANAKK